MTTPSSSKTTRVLLVYPPSHTQSHSSCPAGIQMLAAVLEKAGHEVHLLDANASANRRTTEDIVRVAAELRPDVVGITLITPIVKEAYRLAGQLREAVPAKLLAGGPHATLLPEEPLAYGFDAVVMGEGEPVIEDTILALLGRRPRESVKGWAYCDEGGAIRNTGLRDFVEELDTLPLPARHMVSAADYGDNPMVHANLFTSRGCPARCGYCAGNLFGKRFRFRSPQNVLAEIRHVSERFGAKHFHFVDDAMSMDRERVLEISRSLIDEGPKITWSMMTRIDAVDEEMLTVGARAGLVRVDYGVESGHPETLKRIHKPHSVAMVRKVVPMTARLGVKCNVFFILGFPWEDSAALDETWRFMVELSPHVDCFHPAIASVLIPFPGTEIYEQYKAQYGFANWWLDGRRCFDAPQPRTHSFFEEKAFARGAVLDADFFRYTPEVRRKIRGIFKYMYLHNLRTKSALPRLAGRVLIEASERLSEMSPGLERVLFSPVRRIGSLAGVA